MENKLYSSEDFDESLQDDDYDDVDILEGLDELDIVEPLTKYEIEEIVLLHADFDVSITALCKLLKISRDRYYNILKKSEIQSGGVDYRRLAFPEEW